MEKLKSWLFQCCSLYIKSLILDISAIRGRLPMMDLTTWNLSSVKFILAMFLVYMLGPKSKISLHKLKILSWGKYLEIVQSISGAMVAEW